MRWWWVVSVRDGRKGREWMEGLPTAFHFVVFVQPGDIDAVASEMFEVRERDQHGNRRVEGKGDKEERREGKRSEGGCW
jgi:hypothetical protein